MIIGIEGGIGVGKTLTMVALGKIEKNQGKRVFANMKFSKDFGDYTYLSKDFINNIFEKVKQGKLDLRNSCLLIDEMHNYMDSRRAISKKNVTMSYWIAQSRHTGKGSSNIYYTTQDKGLIDLRLRKRTDRWLEPMITKWRNSAPIEVSAIITTKIYHKWQQYRLTLDTSKILGMYDTHELIDF